MKDQKTVKILWLSDIHFRSSYDHAAVISDPLLDAGEKEFRKKSLIKIDSLIKAFITKIKEYCTELARNNEHLNYILISGDLAFSASTEDYSLLHKKILKEVIEISGTGTKILTVPGNHDVDWTASTFFKEFIYRILGKSEREIKKEYFQLRKDFLKGKDDFFKTIFANYSDHFRQYVRQSHNDIEISREYSEDGLYGLIIDKPNNLVINLLNSAWFALGENFDTMLIQIIAEHYRSVIKDSAKSKRHDAVDEYDLRFKKFVTSVISLKSAMSEYGEQVLGEDFVIQEDPFKKLEECPGYFVLTVFHHPMNWLQYGEKYKLNSSENDQLFLNRLLKYSDMLLTGHEHVPASSISEKINRVIHHLKAGMFMQDNLFSKDIEGEHRFSILEIDTNRFRFKENKYVYDWDGQTYTYNEKSSIAQWETTNIKHPKLNNAKEAQLTNKVKNPEVLRKVLVAYFFKHGQEAQMTLLREYENYNLYKCLTTSHSKLLVLSLASAFYRESLQREMITADDVHCFDEIVKVALAENIQTISLITPDFMIDEALTGVYHKAEYTTEINYTAIVKKADFIFNRARHHFFSRFEKKMELSSITNPIVNSIDFQLIRDLRFSNLIVPFWGIERYGWLGGNEWP